MNKIQRKVLNHLLDLYEQSKTFMGQNKLTQSFSVEVGKLFQKYEDDAEYDYFCEVNDALEELEHKSLIKLERAKNRVLKKASLNMTMLRECYESIGRISRREEQAWLLDTWQKLERSINEEGGTPSRQLQPLLSYISVQREKILKNQKIEYYDGKRADYEDLLKMTVSVLKNEQEIFVRNFSIQLFGDSKRIEQLRTKLQSLLFQYGDFEEKESVLEECGIVHTPTYVMIKGNGRILLNNQTIDLSQLKGDIALSTASIKELSQVEVFGDRIITIENLTSFHDYEDRRDFVIYLGGFHNKVKREFLSFLYKCNREKEYRHFGDIDAGGFYILEHLKRKTGIPFMSLYMDCETLKRHMGSIKALSPNDKKRIEDLIHMLKQRETEQKENQQYRYAGCLLEDYREVLTYMLENNCKLEQEAVRVSEM